MSTIGTSNSSAALAQKNDDIPPPATLENIVNVPVKSENDAGAQKPQPPTTTLPLLLLAKEETEKIATDDSDNPPSPQFLNHTTVDPSAKKPPPPYVGTVSSRGRRKPTPSQRPPAPAPAAAAAPPKERVATAPYTEACGGGITTTSSRKYHALRKSRAFTGPVIFLSWDDCLRFTNPFGGNVTEFQSFDNILDALEYTSFSRKRPTSKEKVPNPSRKKAKTAKVVLGGEKDKRPQAIKQESPIKVNKPKRSEVYAAKRLKEIKQHNKQFEATRSKIDKQWEDNFENLKQYKESHGNCDVSPENGKYNSLAVWITSVYHEMHQFEQDPTGVHENMTQERLQRLKDLGLVETPQMKRDRAWDEKFERLTKYKSEHGDCNVSADTDSDLASWLKFMQHQMRQFEHEIAPAAMTQDRYQRLKDLGASGSLRTDYKNLNTMAGVNDDMWWEEMFLELAAFKEKHGHTSVPWNRQTMLLNFAVYQRKEFAKLKQGKTSKLTKERIARLNGLGFDFTTQQRISWDKRAVEWLEYRTKHGCDPPFKLDGGLGKWVYHQRRRYRIAQLGNNTKRGISKEQIEKLENWGFSWKEEKGDEPKKKIVPKVYSWEQRYAQLLKFAEEHGHMRVSKDYPGGLGCWCGHQRRNYRKCKAGEKTTMTPDRMAKLQRIGFDFNPRKNAGLCKEESIAIGPRADSDTDSEVEIKQENHNENINGTGVEI